jgi:hypothetical protein
MKYMDFNELLKNHGFDPSKVIAMRHRPRAPKLRAALPWLAAENPDIFNFYQSTQSPKVEKALQALTGHGYVASFIGQNPSKATFVGLYRVASSKLLEREKIFQIPEFISLNTLAENSFGENDDRKYINIFNLEKVDFYNNWQGKIIIDWPPPELSWWRRSEKNIMPVSAILEESAFVKGMPAWDQIDLSWQELSVLPRSWQETLSQWRGIYFIHDGSDGRGYIGSAYGERNLLGRWLSYAASGHGGNALLRGRDPVKFRFSILQLLSPHMNAEDVIRIEANWKDRLHTRKPHGLNDN